MGRLHEIRSILSDSAKRVMDKTSDEARGTLLMRAFGLTKVPLLFLTSPSVVKLDADECHIRMPFRKLVKNHLGSMYFGALSIGADACVGLAAMDEIGKHDESISLVFKNFQAEFIKRAEGDTLFICKEKTKIRELVEETIRTGERVHLPINAEAFVNDECVARFVLTLSLKLKS